MTSIVVEYLQQHFGDNSQVSIAYIYCNFKRIAEQNSVELLASLTKQIAQNLAAFPQQLNTLYQTHAKFGTRPLIGEWSWALQNLCALQERTFIVIDALDECDGGSGRQTKLLSEIFRLQELCQIHFFATSRENPKISALFVDRLKLEIRASDVDIELYLDAHMSDFPRCVRGDQELKRNVKVAIIKAVDGM